MKFKNISLAEKHQDLLDHIKWNIWHNKVKAALIKVDELIKLKRLYKYLSDNNNKLINYAERKRRKLIFTSQASESTVEGLINQRCKGKQHMQWSRSGPLLPAMIG